MPDSLVTSTSTGPAAKVVRRQTSTVDDVEFVSFQGSNEFEVVDVGQAPAQYLVAARSYWELLQSEELVRDFRKLWNLLGSTYATKTDWYRQFLADNYLFSGQYTQFLDNLTSGEQIIKRNGYSSIQKLTVCDAMEELADVLRCASEAAPHVSLENTGCVQPLVRHQSDGDAAGNGCGHQSSGSTLSDRRLLCFLPISQPDRVVQILIPILTRTCVKLALEDDGSKDMSVGSAIILSQFNWTPDDQRTVTRLISSIRCRSSKQFSFSGLLNYVCRLDVLEGIAELFNVESFALSIAEGADDSSGSLSCSPTARQTRRARNDVEKALLERVQLVDFENVSAVVWKFVRDKLAVKWKQLF